MLIKVDLQCYRCYKKIKKVLGRIPRESLFLKLNFFLECIDDRMNKFVFFFYVAKKENWVIMCW